MEGTAEKNWNEPLVSFTQKKTQHRDWRYFEMFQTISFETTKGYAVCHLDNSLNVSWSLPDLSRIQTASINSPAVNQKKTVYKVAFNVPVCKNRDLSNLTHAKVIQVICKKP